MLFERDQRIVCIGDSITDCGRRQEAAPFGNGYVSLVRAFLLARYPALNIGISNEGISGDTIRDLAQRWSTDVIDHRPHWVSIMIGINDVWRWMTGRYSEAVPLDEYHQTYKSLLERTVSEIQARIILLQPFLVEPNIQDPFRLRLEPYIEVVNRLASEFSAVIVPTQTAFNEALQSQPSSFWARDRVHPTAIGHAVLARSWLRAAGYGDI
ncbi:MAG: SGNH/GDSL hydrolase family protein [Chloroflexi bacterium]|nr:SGNH/GDSL hydrolase family protein [Chloroflexota bacterium]